MANMFDRLSQGPTSDGRGSYDNWNEMVGSAPPERFGRAAYDAIRQVDQRDYYEHTQPGVGGTDPYGALPSQERQGLVERILGELTRRGLGRDEVTRRSGVRDLDPSHMSAGDLASLTQWMQRDEPKAYGRVAAQYKDKPNVLESLMGNKGLMMLLAGIGGKLLMDRMRK